MGRRVGAVSLGSRPRRDRSGPRSDPVTPRRPRRRGRRGARDRRAHGTPWRRLPVQGGSPTPGERRRRRCHRRDLPRGDGLDSRVQLVGRQHHPLVEPAGEGVPGAGEETRAIAIAVERIGHRRRRDGERRWARECRHRGRRGPELAQAGAARRAVAQVRPQRRDVLGRSLPVSQRGQRRRPPRALAPCLDLGVAVEESATALGQTTIDLRVRPVRDLGDLAVGVALRLEHEGADLLGLEPGQRLGRAADALGVEGPLVRGLQVARLGAVEIDLGRADDPPARRADRQRLVLDHRAQPRRSARGIERVGAGQQDLQRALAGVMSVVGTQRVAPRDREHRGRVLGGQLEHQLAPCRGPGRVGRRHECGTGGRSRTGFAPRASHPARLRRSALCTMRGRRAHPRDARPAGTSPHGARDEMTPASSDRARSRSARHLPRQMRHRRIVWPDFAGPQTRGEAGCRTRSSTRPTSCRWGWGSGRRRRCCQRWSWSCSRTSAPTR